MFRRWLLVLPLLAVPLLALCGPSDVNRAETLRADQVVRWTDPARRAETIAAQRAENPEWDFMWRAFLVLALADDALSHVDRTDDDLVVIDDLIADTRRQVAAHGQAWFLMPYVHRAPFVDETGRSVFVDGELALMMAARRLVREDDSLREPMWERLAVFVGQVERSPALLAESYPDEAWMFCNNNALVALRMGDLLDGRDHDALIRRRLAASDALKEPSTGLLGSEFTRDGRMQDGPEGSSIWLVAVNLLLLDPDRARDQYERARAGLYRSIGSLGYAREWGDGWQGPVDVDSGPIVPVLEASPSSSGFALLAAHAFGDEPTYQALLRSLRAADLAGGLTPELTDNAVGNAVVLHGLSFGPLWAEVQRRQARRP